MKNRFVNVIFCAGLVLAGMGLNPATAADWSTTEFQFAYGELDDPFVPESTDTFVWTLQHASGWKYGDNFFFVDLISPKGGDLDAYAEVYMNLSLGKITGNDLKIGPINDFGVLAGYNFAAVAGAQVYLPGVRLAWDIPGFAFANTDFMAYLTDNRGGEDKAPKEGDSWMVDFNFSTKQLVLGPTKWNMEGHVEYVGARSGEFGDVKEWILAQPQVRLDLGDLIGLGSNQLFAGIEYQYWMNKLGGDKEESAVQALLVWRL